MAGQKHRSKYDSKPAQGETEIGKQGTDQVVYDPAFQFFEQPTIGVRFHIFQRIGEELQGVILGQPLQNVRRHRSYPIRLTQDCEGSCHCQNGETIEVFGTAHLGPKLKRCIGYPVRIVYLGRKHKYSGHYMKIFRVYRIEGRKESLLGMK